MLVRTVLFPVRLTLGVGKASAKGGYKAGRASVIGSYKAGHLLGYRRMATLGLGVGLGLLLASPSGQGVRDKLKASLPGGPASPSTTPAGPGDSPVPVEAVTPTDAVLATGAGVSPAPVDPTPADLATPPSATPPPADADS
jgi:hypothetical protein